MELYIGKCHPKWQEKKLNTTKMQLIFAQISIFQCAILFPVKTFVNCPADPSFDVYIIILSHRIEEK